ncbi:MAG: aminopeptidase [Planctomycetota bacterium]|nr:aminopeptidase [Planctomycetota bacterium]
MSEPISKRKKWLRRGLILFLFLLAGGVALVGCGGIYIIKLGMGQARILLDREPITKVLADPAVESSVKDKLRLILEVRDFAEKELGLVVGNNYLYYFDTGGDPIIYTITASPKDRLEAYYWKFPIVGAVAYKGFFDLDDAREESEEMAAEGYDTNLGSAQAFSTLGWFSDPVFTTMLLRRPELVVETVIHELTHATIYVKGETPFNESLATFIGIAGAIEFLIQRYGEESAEVRFARAVQQDRQIFSRFMEELRVELDDLYAEPIPLAEKLSRREGIFRASQERVAASDELETDQVDFYPELEMNNAVVLSLLHYHTRIDFFEGVFEEEDRNLRRTILRIREDPEKALSRWQSKEE